METATPTVQQLPLLLVLLLVLVLSCPHVLAVG